MAESYEPTFQRAPHNKENPYAQLSRALIRDATLSPECRWMLLYLLSMSDDFKIKVKSIWNHTQAFMGRDKIRRLIDEACEAGYIKKEQQFKGQLKRGIIYYVSEEPNEEFKKCFRRPGFQAPEAEAPENQGALRSITSNEVIPTIDKKEGGTSPPVSISTSFGKFVKMAPQEYDQLSAKMTKDVLDEIIETMNDAISAGTCKQYKDYPAAIRNWYRRRAKEPQITGKTAYVKVGLETIQKRMEWAQQNEWSSPGGYAAAGEKAYETNGQKYEYTAVHPFWSNLGL